MATKQSKKDSIQLERLAVTWVPIDSIASNTYNPNRMTDHEFALLKNSIQEDGFTTPIIVRRDDNQIVDGEHRWRACKALGFTEIAVVFVDMSEAQRRISTIRHNVARGSHDIEMEAGVLRDLQKLGALDWAQDSLGLADEEINRMLQDFTPIDAYGNNEDYNQSWDYEKIGESGEIQATEAAQFISKLPGNPIERRRLLEQQQMQDKDLKLVRHNFTFTDEETKIIKEALGNEKPAQALMGMAQSMVEDKRKLSRGEWASLTFTVPVGALKLIEDELDRISRLAPTITPELSEVVKRGLALEFMATLSSQTPEESLL